VLDASATNHRVTLADGRTLAYCDIGDPDGHAVISCHGGLSSRLDVVPSADAARHHGLRVISPDRPGIGGSNRKPGRTLVDWPADVAELADALGLDRFAVMGWSLGGAYAAACAHGLGERVTAATLVASTIPPDWDDMREELNRMDRVLLSLSGRAAPVERAIFHLLHATAHHAPHAFAKQSGVEGDLAVELPRAVAEGLGDPAGVVDDYRVFGAPWGFAPSDLAQPVQLWQGDADELVPLSWGERLAASVPGATLNIVAGASHFLWYDHWDDIFTAMRDVP